MLTLTRAVAFRGEINSCPRWEKKPRGCYAGLVWGPEYMCERAEAATVDMIVK